MVHPLLGTTYLAVLLRRDLRSEDALTAEYSGSRGSGLLRIKLQNSMGACMSLDRVSKGIHRGHPKTLGKRRRKEPRALKRLEEAPDLGPQRCRRSGFGMLRQGFGMFTRGMGSMRLGGIAEIKCLRECKRPAM